MNKANTRILVKTHLSSGWLLTGDRSSSGTKNASVVVVGVVVVVGAAVVLTRFSRPNLRRVVPLGFGLVVVSDCAGLDGLLCVLLIVVGEGDEVVESEGEATVGEAGEESENSLTIVGVKSLLLTVLATLMPFSATALGASITLITVSPAFTVPDSELTEGDRVVDAGVVVAGDVTDVGGRLASLLVTVTFSDVTPTQNTVLDFTNVPLKKCTYHNTLTYNYHAQT